MKKLVLFLLFPILTYGQVQIGQDIDGLSAGERFGLNVSLSEDGNILATSGRANDQGNLTGLVRVYKFQENSWVQIGQEINENSGDIDINAVTISLSSSGNILAIGVQQNDDNGTNSGKVKVFQNIDENWVQIGQEIYGDSGDFLGATVGLSSDGNTLAIGSPGQSSNGNQSGQVQVYNYTEDTWIQIGQDIQGQSEADILGTSISISSDGNILAISAPLYDGGEFNGGLVRTFQYQENTWVQIGQDIVGENLDQFGRDISLSSNGLVLAIQTYANENSLGQTRIYKYEDDLWAQIGQNINGEETSGQFQSKVSLSPSGDLVSIGSSYDTQNGTSSGVVRVFRNINESWTQIGLNLNGENENDFFGYSVNITSNGILAIGATGVDTNIPNSGQVKVFNLSDLLSTETFTPSTFSLYPNPASTQVTIDVPQGIALEKATIYNSLGQQILSSKETTIATSYLSRGVYIVEVTTNLGTSSKKLIIE